jgi:hypothetical protein
MKLPFPMFSLIGHRFLPEADLPLHAQNRRLLDAEKGIGGPARAHSTRLLRPNESKVLNCRHF